MAYVEEEENNSGKNPSNLLGDIRNVEKVVDEGWFSLEKFTLLIYTQRVVTLEKWDFLSFARLS